MRRAHRDCTSSTRLSLFFFLLRKEGRQVNYTAMAATLTVKAWEKIRQKLEAAGACTLNLGRTHLHIHVLSVCHHMGF